jgi:peptidoglycan hydrolase-like protein with peptidoglycan-binding domain
MRRALVRSLQRALKAKRFNPGSVDGILGRHTAPAQRGFQLMAPGAGPGGETGPVKMDKLGM